MVKKMNVEAASKLRTSPQVRANTSAEAPRIPPLANPFKGGGLLLLTILGLAVVASATPLAAEGWEFNRNAILNGEWGRILTGHLTHWNFDHFLWDAATLLALGVACVWRSVGRTVAALLGAAIAISAALLLFQPEIIAYRGLSGLDSALFMLLTASLWRESRADGRRGLGVVALVATTAFLAKAAYEATTGTTLFVDSADAGFIPLASAHLVGGVVGLLVGLSPKRDASS